MEFTIVTINDTDIREVVITRKIDAPHEKVFKAWSEAEQKNNGGGPKGFGGTFDQLEAYLAKA